MMLPDIASDLEARPLGVGVGGNIPGGGIPSQARLRHRSEIGLELTRGQLAESPA
jgi:hypothetical protein